MSFPQLLRKRRGRNETNLPRSCVLFGVILSTCCATTLTAPSCMTSPGLTMKSRLSCYPPATMTWSKRSAVGSDQIHCLFYLFFSFLLLYIKLCCYSIRKSATDNCFFSQKLYRKLCGITSESSQGSEELSCALVFQLSRSFNMGSPLAHKKLFWVCPVWKTGVRVFQINTCLFHRPSFAFLSTWYTSFHWWSVTPQVLLSLTFFSHNYVNQIVVALITDLQQGKQQFS